jgi:pilus assembly protein CpaB
MRRKLMGIIAAVALASVGTLVLVAYVQSARNSALAQEQMVEVLVVSKPVPKGMKGDQLAAFVEVDEVPAKVKAEGAVTDLSTVASLVADVDLTPGEQLLASRFVEPAVAAQGDVPPGLLQVTVTLPVDRALGGRIRAGQTVGVVATFEDATHLMLHKVLVTDVQAEQVPTGEGTAPETGMPRQSTGGNYMLTLAVDAPAVERLVFAAETGKLWLASEPLDAPQVGTKIVNRGNVLEAQ